MLSEVGCLIGRDCLVTHTVYEGKREAVRRGGGKG